jgi:PAS domain S-box-containing protein
MQTGLATYVITLTFGTVMAAVLATLAWSRRNTPGAVPFALAMCAILIATMCRILFSVGAVETVYFWSRLRLVALMYVPAFAMMFVLAYVGHRKWARFPRAWLFLIVPILLSLAIWTHDHWFWTGWSISEVTGTRSEVFAPGLLWRVNLLYSYGCFIALIGLLVRSMMISIQPVRSQTLLLSLGWTVMFVSNMPFAVASLGRYIPNLTNAGFVLGGFFFLTALRRQGFLERVPLALQTVYHSMQDGVIVFDATRRIASVNPTAERILGQSADELIGKPAREAFAHRPDLVERFRGLATTSNQEVEHAGAVYDFSVSPIVENGEPSGHVLVIRDITARKKAEHHAVELAVEHERMRLLAGVIRDTSQELRAPLTAINAAVFQAQRTTSPQDRKDRLAQIEMSTAHMLQIIESLQLLADLDVRTQLNLSEFAVKDWLETLPNAVRELIERRGHRLVREFDRENPLMISGDFYLLRAALQQLLHNAAIYTPVGGTITVRAQRTEGNVEITVIDTGVGMSPEALEAIFTRFPKLNKQRTGSGTGAGVGLSIVKKVIELHGGSISASSTPGKGSAFTIWLPLQGETVAEPRELSLIS